MTGGLPRPAPGTAAPPHRAAVLGDGWDGADGAPDLRVGDDVPTLQAAVDAAGDMPKSRVVIQVPPGHHAGPVLVPPDGPKLTIRGPGAGRAALAARVEAQMPGLEYAARYGAAFDRAAPATRDLFARIAARERLTTGNAAVLRIERDGTVVSGLTIRNDYACDRPEAAPAGAVPDADGRYAEGQHQAVAVHVAGADRVRLTGLRLSSFQDTLYLQAPGRTLVETCEIEGDVDFIFGGGTAWFEDCEIRSRGLRGAPSWALAPSTNIRAPHGFVLCACRFIHDGAEAGRDGGFFLGRQWFEGVRATPYGTPDVPGYVARAADRNVYRPPEGRISRATLEAVGKVMLVGCRIGGHVDPARPWDDWASGRWSPRFRPVQAGAGDFLRYLGNWLDREGLDYADLDPDEEWLVIR
ncbi:hypothetical protein HKCCE2091_16460 [Rhodobacterales bacterium HKCCE2091]|nr:hypothetical protein [Rhodobacterales bacterium HKCCE2091]